jgi:hypothetical protein
MTVRRMLQCAMAVDSVVHGGRRLVSSNESQNPIELTNVEITESLLLCEKHFAALSLPSMMQ